MARTIPSGPYLGNETTSYQPGLPILHADADEPTAHWQHLAGALNLALATLGAQTANSAGWADLQGHVNAVGWNNLTRVLLPPAPSVQHTTVEVRAYVRSAAAGEIRFSSESAGDGPDVVAAGVSYAWAIATLTVDVADESILVEVSGQIDVLVVEAEYLPLAPNGDYPDADDEFAAELFDEAALVPVLDDDDFGDNEPGGADVLVDTVDIVTHLLARPLPIGGGSAILITGDENLGWMANQPIRLLTRVPYGGCTLKLRIELENDDEADQSLWIQHGPGEPTAVVGTVAGAYIHEEVIAGAAALDIIDVELFLDDQNDLDAPDYPGATHVAIYAPFPIHIYSVVAWLEP